jgi:hypothetical protein
MPSQALQGTSPNFRYSRKFGAALSLGVGVKK